MFEFGKEQPTANNESLYEKKSDADELISDQSKGRDLNRYSFVNKDGDVESVSLLIREILGQIGLRVVIIVSWLIKLPDRSLLAAKVIEKRYLKDGWNVSSRKDHYLAIKEVQLSEIDAWKPLFIDPLIGGGLLFVGNKSDEDMLNVLNTECTSFLARNWYFVPNAEFFKQLELENMSAMYQVNDDLGNTGIILVGKHSISMASTEDINICAIYEGDFAYKVFV